LPSGERCIHFTKPVPSNGIRDKHTHTQTDGRDL
jgi:hypothetical protein